MYGVFIARTYGAFEYFVFRVTNIIYSFGSFTDLANTGGFIMDNAASSNNCFITNIDTVVAITSSTTVPNGQQLTTTFNNFAISL